MQRHCALDPANITVPDRVPRIVPGPVDTTEGGRDAVFAQEGLPTLLTSRLSAEGLALKTNRTHLLE